MTVLSCRGPSVGKPTVGSMIGLVALLLNPGVSYGQDNKAPSHEQADIVQMSREQQTTVKLQTALAMSQAITQPVRVAGTIAFDPGHIAVLRPYEQAKVTRLLVREGDPVAEGQPLAELDTPGLVNNQQNLAAARASVREAEAGVQVARDALRRGEILARDGSLARAEAERRRLVVAQAVAAADTARFQTTALESAVARLNPSGRPGIATLTSPLTGVVVSVGINGGELVDQNRDAFTVADLSTLLVLAQVPEASAALVAVGDPAEVVLATAGSRRWSGTIAGLGAALDPQARTLPARIKIANPDGALRVGMFVTITITSAAGRNAVTVPAAAVQLVGNKQVVFTPLGDDRFQSHEVIPGVERQDWVEVRQGIAAGAQVVTQGSFELKALLQKSLLDGG